MISRCRCRLGIQRNWRWQWSQFNNILGISSRNKTQLYVFSSFADGRGEKKEIGELLIPIRKRLDVSMQSIRHLKGSNYVQLATIDGCGDAAVRTLVYRGQLELNADTPHTSICAMKMITDARSEKFRHLQLSPRCEVVWWMSQTMEQYRFSCTALTVTSAESDPTLCRARLDMWEALSPPARNQFYWPHPGCPVSAQGVQLGDVDAVSSVARIEALPDEFVLLLLVPFKMKYLRLSDNYAQVDVLEHRDITPQDDDSNVAKSDTTIKEAEEVGRVVEELLKIPRQSISNGENNMNKEKMFMWSSCRVNP